MLPSETSCGGSCGGGPSGAAAGVAGRGVSLGGVGLAGEKVDADAPESVGTNMMSLVLRMRVREETRTQTLSYAGKCGAGAVAKVSCTVAGRLARTVCQLVIGWVLDTPTDGAKGMSSVRRAAIDTGVRHSLHLKIV